MKAYTVPIIILCLGAMAATLNEVLTDGALTHSTLLTAYAIGGLTLGGVVATLRIPK